MSRGLVSVEMLGAFCDAWNLHDIDGLMSFMSDNCVFDSAAGPDPWGTRYSGRDEVRAGYEKIFNTFPDATWHDAKHFVAGARGVSEWRFTGTMPDGTVVEMHGCDIFTFSGDKIRIKDPFRKLHT